MDLEFRNLTYTVYNRITKAKQREVVKGVHGRFLSGNLVAIMGPSGAGKSSLLNAISGYRQAGVTGELLVNGSPRVERVFQRRSCYITQEDLHQPLLSVREALDVAARLKLPRGAAPHAADILLELGLLDHQHTRTDQLSGGQKKRLSIALELVNNPPVFFLDEPTSGLDNVTTAQCVRLLRRLARGGRTVVATIHQPAASLLTLFDQVYVIADGRCVYQGDTAEMVPHLASIGFPCPTHHNPADFIIELTESMDNINFLCNEIMNGKVFKSAKMRSSSSSSLSAPPSLELRVSCEAGAGAGAGPGAGGAEAGAGGEYTVPAYARGDGDSSSLSQGSQGSGLDSSLAWMKVHSADGCGGYATTYFQQFTTLLFRMIKQIARNKQGLWIQTVHHVMCGLLIGLCFFGMANDGTQMFSHLKMCVGLVLFFAYTQIMVPVLVFPTEVKLVKKEHFNRWYALAPYYCALTVSKLPLQLALNVVFSSLVYWLAAVPWTAPRFLVFCIIGNVVSLVAEGMGLAIGSVFNVRNGCAIGPTTIAPFLGLAIYGFDFAPRIPRAMALLMRASFIRGGIVAMVLTVFGFGRGPLDCADVYCHFAEPDALLHYLDIHDRSVWMEIFVMLCIMVFFRTLCFIGLKWRFAK